MLAPILLCVCRMLQGLAMGGEFGSAVVYISELAGASRRGATVALLQMTVNIGMILATLLVMLLQNTVSAGTFNLGPREPRLRAPLSQATATSPVTNPALIAVQSPLGPTPPTPPSLPAPPSPCRGHALLGLAHPLPARLWHSCGGHQCHLSLHGRAACD